MATTSNASAELPDFSAPWKFSDVVLVAEDQRFHVHRNILALWSPVFEKMFTSEFQEKSKDEIPLPEKKASEINELLLLIYPNVTGKPWVTITQNNCHFLAKFAQEYQIDSIFRKCEEFLVNKMLTKEENIINELIFAQTYKLEKLVLTSVGEASNLSLRELNAHAMCDLIEPSNYKKIVEGIVQRLEKELEEAHLEHRKIKGVKEKCLKEVFELTRFLIEHADKKKNRHFTGVSGLDRHLFVLEQDRDSHYCPGSGVSSKVICPSLSSASVHLRSVKQALESLL